MATGITVCSVVFVYFCCHSYTWLLVSLCVLWCLYTFVATPIHGYWYHCVFCGVCILLLPLLYMVTGITVCSVVFVYFCCHSYTWLLVSLCVLWCLYTFVATPIHGYWYHCVFCGVCILLLPVLYMATGITVCSVVFVYFCCHSYTWLLVSLCVLWCLYTFVASPIHGYWYHCVFCGVCILLLPLLYMVTGITVCSVVFVYFCCHSYTWLLVSLCVLWCLYVYCHSHTQLPYHCVFCGVHTSVATPIHSYHITVCSVVFILLLPLPYTATVSLCVLWCLYFYCHSHTQLPYHCVFCGVCTSIATPIHSYRITVCSVVFVRLLPLPYTATVSLCLVAIWKLSTAVKAVFTCSRLECGWTTTKNRRPLCVLSVWAVSVAVSLSMMVLRLLHNRSCWWVRVASCSHCVCVHPYFYQSIFVFTHPNDGWTGLYIKLWRAWCMRGCVRACVRACMRVCVNCMQLYKVFSWICRFRFLDKDFTVNTRCLSSCFIITFLIIE